MERRTNEVMVEGVLTRRLLRRIRKAAHLILAQLGLRGASLTLVLLSGRNLAAFKKRFARLRDTKPDVAAFPEPKGFPHPDVGRRPLGEVYLNCDIAREDFERFAMLLIHGILHLVGYEHRRNRDMIKMQNKEARIWRHVSSSVWMSAPRQSK
jgi:probable rRNA maturation factor